MNDYANVDQNTRQKMENVKNDLPGAYRAIIWEKNCHIINNGFREYLFKVTDHDYDGDRRRVFTHIPKGVCGTWEVQPGADGYKFTFRETNCNWFLYAASSGFNYDGERRRIFLWKKDGAVAQAYWRLEPRVVDGKYVFKLKNTEYNEYLYSANDYFNFDDHKRRVFTWIPGNAVHNSDWEFICGADFGPVNC